MSGPAELMLVARDRSAPITAATYLLQVAAPAHEVLDLPMPEKQPDERGLCVLVVDDNLDVGRFCTQNLQDHGHFTLWVHNGEAALADVEKALDRFDAVFSDVVMPGMGGVDLARRFQSTLPDLPIVLTSGCSDVLARDDAHGFDLVRKPYLADQVSQAFRFVPPRPKGRAQG